MEDSIIAYVINSIPWGTIILAYIVIFLDLFYGVLVSVIMHDVESHKMLKGLQRKTFVLFVPLFGVVIKAFLILADLPSEWSGSEAINSFLGVAAISDFPICFLLCVFIILMEVYSMLESSAKIDGRAQKLLAFFNKKTKEEIENGHTVKKVFGKG